MTHAKALQAEYAACTSNLDDSAVKMIASGEAIMKFPAHVLLAQMGIIPPPTALSTTSTASAASMTAADKARSKPFALLDNACGPGLIAGLLQEHVDRDILGQSRILCADVNANFVDICKQRAEAEGWSGVETAVLDAQDPGLPDNSFDYSTVNFAMHIIPDPDAVLKTTKALLKPSGVLGITTIHPSTTGWSTDVIAALNSLSSALTSPPPPIPPKVSMTPNNRPEWAETDGVHDALSAHGFEAVKVHILPHKSPVLSGADWVERFAMMARMVTGTYWDEQTRQGVEEELLAKQSDGSGEFGKVGGGLLGYIEKFLDERHGGQGWELDWAMVVATGQKPVFA